MDRRHIETFLKKRHIVQQFQQDGNEYQVSITLPDLRNNTFRVWGDWGPMLSIALEPYQSIFLVYSDGDRQARFVIEPKQLALLSPALVAERQVHPFYLEIDDWEREVRLLVYFDSKGDFDHLEVKKRHPQAALRKVFEKSAVSSRTDAERKSA